MDVCTGKNSGRPAVKMQCTIALMKYFVSKQSDARKSIFFLAKASFFFLSNHISGKFVLFFKLRKVPFGTASDVAFRDLYR